MFRRLTALLLIALVGAFGQPAFAQTLPAGTYRQSCSDARVRGNELSANCSAPDGRRIRSSVTLDCRGDIGNVNGYLRCNGGRRGGAFGRHDGMSHGYPGGGHFGPGAPGSGFGGGVPSGTYQQSCTNIRMQGGRLVASCSATNGGRVTSSLDVGACRRNADIGNHNGSLSCRR